MVGHRDGETFGAYGEKFGAKQKSSFEDAVLHNAKMKWRSGDMTGRLLVCQG